jgi:undecaprenyl-diphosphatase
MQLTLWQIVILAIIQGVTEFLPVSSSGHLVIAAAVLTNNDAEALDVSDVNIMLHMGTLLSILVFYWQRVVRLMGQDRRTLHLLAVATLPAVVVGLPLKLFLEELLESPLLAGCLLIVTGLVLLWVARRKQGSAEYQQLSYGQSLFIGICQAFAILPGLSRSGTTISAGLSANLSPRSAATFSFLMAIPAIGGAGLLEVAHLASGAEVATPLRYLAVGALIAFAVGLISLWWLVQCLERGRLQWFAWWCIPVGLAVVIWQVSA